MDEYVVVSKEMSFEKLLTYFRSSIPMTERMGGVVRISKPIVEKIIETQDMVEINNVVRELLAIYQSVNPKSFDYVSASLLRSILGETVRDAIVGRCRDLLVLAS